MKIEFEENLELLQRAVNELRRLSQIHDIKKATIDIISPVKEEISKDGWKSFKQGNTFTYKVEVEFIRKFQELSETSMSTIEKEELEIE